MNTVARPPMLWAGMLGGPIIWSVHLLLVWAISEFSCRLPLASRTGFGLNLIHVLVFVVSIIAIIASVVIGLLSYRTWQQISAEETQSRAVDRARFMLLTGILMTGLFLLVMFFMTVPVFVLPACS